MSENWSRQRNSWRVGVVSALTKAGANSIKELTAHAIRSDVRSHIKAAVQLPERLWVQCTSCMREEIQNNATKTDITKPVDATYCGTASDKKWRRATSAIPLTVPTTMELNAKIRKRIGAADASKVPSKPECF